MKKFLSILLAALLLTVAAVSSAETLIPEEKTPVRDRVVHLEGYAAADFSGDMDSHWVGFDSDDPASVESYAFGLTTYAAAYYNGSVYGYVYGYDASGALQDGFYTFDTKDHIVSYPGGTSNGVFVYGMAFNYADGNMYALCDEDHPYLATVDLETGELTTVVNVQLGSYLGIYTFAIDGNGVFYALTMSAVNARLVRIDPATGALTEVGATGKPCYYAQSMTCDVETGVIYWAHLESNFNNGLYTVDPETAEIEFIGQIGPEGMELTGLYIVPENEPVVPPAYTLGDVNGNGTVEVGDAILALRAAMNITELDETQQLAADINENGSVEVTDTISILRFAMGLIDEF
ncbi:MAG: hypothetical protein IJM20_07525 [Clostridia bacterium]|nr:hypothetical protein [Clostridia bacterium]